MRRQQIVRDILETSRVQTTLADIAAESGKAFGGVQKHAKQCLKSLVAIQNPWFSEVFDRVLGPMHTNAWTLDIDRASLKKLEALDRDNMLIFLPTHRSYADPFILTRVIRESALRKNYILGGDNIGFWPMGSIVRRAGAILIRRSFGDDKVYKAMLREYLAYLARTGSNLEWYMEGGRSRTGKLRPPMYGLLRYLSQALKLERSKSVILVPVAITYDQLHEIHAMAAEEVGDGKKKKESISWLANYARMQSQWIGTAYVRFGKPISVMEMVDRDPQQSWMIEKLAIEVFQRINRVTPVTGPALATLALLAVRNRALTLPEIETLVSPLLDYAGRRKLPTEGVKGLKDESGILESLDSLVKAEVLGCYERGLERVYNIQPGSHNIAAFYRNSAIHWFINRAILEVALLHMDIDDRDDVFYVGWDAIHRLRDTLKFEFFFSDRLLFKEEMRAEAYILAPDFFERVSTRADRRQLLLQAPFLIAHRVLTPFLEAYALVAECLYKRGDESLGDKVEFLDECTRIGRQYVLQYRISTPESISQELFKNALKLAANRELLEARPGLKSERLDWMNYLREMVDAAGEVDAFDVQRREHVANQRAQNEVAVDYAD